MCGTFVEIYKWKNTMDKSSFNKWKRLRAFCTGDFTLWVYTHVRFNIKNIKIGVRYNNLSYYVTMVILNPFTPCISRQYSKERCDEMKN